MQIGYARISTDGQDCALQLDALRHAGCERIFTETASGARADRQELAQALDMARAGDTIVCWRLDRLERSLRHLIEIAEILRRRGVALRSLSEAIADHDGRGGRPAAWMCAEDPLPAPARSSPAWRGQHGPWPHRARQDGRLDDRERQPLSDQRGCLHDDLALHLGERSEHVKEEPAAGGRGVGRGALAGAEAI
jgi:hypothetical protein